MKLWNLTSRWLVAASVGLAACSPQAGQDTAPSSPSPTTTSTTLAESAVTSTTSTLPEGTVPAFVPLNAATFGDPGDEVMAGVVGGGPGLVAVGSDYQAGDGSDGSEVSDGDAAVWTRDDSNSSLQCPTLPCTSEPRWSRVPHDEAVFGGPGYQEMQGVVASEIVGLVAVGFDSSGGDADAAVWTSPDGLTWSRVPRDDVTLGGAGDQQMLKVVAGGPGLVAVGSDDSGGDVDAAVWTSPDGVTWSRIPHDEALFGGPGDEVIQGVAMSGAVGLVAVGIDRFEEDADAAVWASIDGVTWSRIPHDEALFGGSGDQVMQGVAVFFSSIIAVGFDASAGGVDAAVWTSPDGMTWARVVSSDSVFGGTGNQEMSDVSTIASERPNGENFVQVFALAAVGSDDSSGDVDAAVWTSPDGLTWTRVVDPGGEFGSGNIQSMNEVVSGSPGLVAVGSDKSGRGRDAAVWSVRWNTIGWPIRRPS